MKLKQHVQTVTGVALEAHSISSGYNILQFVHALYAAFGSKGHFGLIRPIIIIIIIVIIIHTLLYSEHLLILS